MPDTLYKKKKQQQETLQGDPDTGVEMIPNDINYNESLHTKQLQHSRYVKIDDNLLNFYLDNSKRPDGSSLKKLHESDFKAFNQKGELNKVHIKYLNEDQVKKKQ